MVAEGNVRIMNSNNNKKKDEFTSSEGQSCATDVQKTKAPSIIV